MTIKGLYRSTFSLLRDFFLNDFLCTAERISNSNCRTQPKIKYRAFECIANIVLDFRYLFGFRNNVDRVTWPVSAVISTVSVICHITIDGVWSEALADDTARSYNGDLGAERLDPWAKSLCPLMLMTFLLYRLYTVILVLKGKSAQRDANTARWLY